jgi:hypothetical protein
MAATALRVRWPFSLRRFVRTFRNAGRETGKVALSFYPSGFEEFFGELAEGSMTAMSASESFKPVPATVSLSFQPMQSTSNRAKRLKRSFGFIRQWISE